MIINVMYCTVSFISLIDSGKNHSWFHTHSLSLFFIFFILAASFSVYSASLYKRNVRITAASFGSVFFDTYIQLSLKLSSLSCQSFRLIFYLYLSRPTGSGAEKFLMPSDRNKVGRVSGEGMEIDVHADTHAGALPRPL